MFDLHHYRFRRSFLKRGQSPFQAHKFLARLRKSKKIDEIGTITTRTTKNKTRLGGEPGEPSVKITYKDGTEFDMTRSRVKETEVNPYKADRYRPKRFEGSLDKKGLNRSPTKEELDWFESIDW